LVDGAFGGVRMTAAAARATTLTSNAMLFVTARDAIFFPR